jgi:hypothetical protein
MLVIRITLNTFPRLLSPDVEIPKCVALVRNSIQILILTVKILHILLFMAASAQYVCTFVTVIAVPEKSKPFKVDVNWIQYIPPVESAFP